MKWLKGVLSLWIWFEIGVVTSIGCVLTAVVTVLTYPFDRHRMIAGRFFRLCAVTCIKLSPLWRFGIHGVVPPRIDGKTVVVSNHVSHMDSFLISHLPWEMKWLAKSSLFKVPFLGWGMRMVGDIAVVRGTGDSVARAMQRCAAYLQRSVPVFIFPEGTRSLQPTLLPFKDGAFRLAVEAGATVLPVAVAGTRRALPKHSWRFDFARALVTVGQPIVTQGLGDDAVQKVKEAARSQIEAMLKEIEPLVAR